MGSQRSRLPSVSAAARRSTRNTGAKCRLQPLLTAGTTPRSATACRSPPAPAGKMDTLAPSAWCSGRARGRYGGPTQPSSGCADHAAPPRSSPWATPDPDEKKQGSARRLLPLLGVAVPAPETRTVGGTACPRLHPPSLHSSAIDQTLSCSFPPHPFVHETHPSEQLCNRYPWYCSNKHTPEHTLT